MKALTIQQPWATLIALGMKRFETRGWQQAAHRGPLAIHAGAEYPRANRLLAATPAFRYALRGIGSLPLGCVVATCELRAIHPTSALVDQLELFPNTDLLTQFQFGDFTAGRFAWELAGIRALYTPIPAKGALGLWEWAPPLSWIDRP